MLPKRLSILINRRKVLTWYLTGLILVVALDERLGRTTWLYQCARCFIFLFYLTNFLPYAFVVDIPFSHLLKEFKFVGLIGRPAVLKWQRKKFVKGHDLQIIKGTIKLHRNDLPHVKNNSIRLTAHNLLHLFIFAMILDSTWKFFHFCKEVIC